VEIKPAREPLDPKVHVSSADSTPLTVEDLKDVQNAQLKLEPEPTDGSLAVHSDLVVSSSGAESGLKNLWNEAYNTLTEKNPKLIDAYEKDLLASQNANQQGMSVRTGCLLAERH